MPEVTLKPCPFCGKTDKLSLDSLGSYDTFCIQCDRCQLSQHAVYTRDQAIAAWNSRPSEGEKCEWNAAIDKCVEAMKAYNVSGYDIVQDRRTGEPEQEQFDIIGYVESFKRPTP